MNNSSIPHVYDTVTDIINDESIKDEMSVLCLGLNDIDDGNGRIYKVMSKLKLGTNDLSLSNGLKAKYIGSINYDKSIESTKKNTAIAKEDISETKEDVETNTEAISELVFSLSENGIMDVISAANIAGVKIFCLVNGLKAVVINRANGYSFPSDGTEQIIGELEEELDNGENFIIRVDVSEDRMWLIPLSLKLIDYENKTLVVNDKLSITYDPENSIIEFSINNKDIPVVYYYM